MQLLKEMGISPHQAVLCFIQSPALATSDLWSFQAFLPLSGSSPKNKFFSSVKVLEQGNAWKFVAFAQSAGTQ